MSNHGNSVRGPQFHHVLFERSAWNSNEASRKLRDNSGLLIPMHPEPHAELHTIVRYVPLLDGVHCFNINNQLKTLPMPKRDPIGNIHRLIGVIDKSLDDFQYDRIRLMVGAAAIEALKMEIPLIEDGIFRDAVPRKIPRTKVDRRKGGQVC